MTFSKLNILGGWLVWLVATITYVSTVEPTMSYWDCGEYISTAVKLQVGHPPGASFFQLMGAFFAMFAYNDPMNKAYFVNLLSALSSSFSIMFLFWTITSLVRRMLTIDLAEDVKKIVVLGSGFVGALSFTFTDTFWFSAVEGEVYAMAVFFVSVLFWAIMKWDAEESSIRSDRWLVFIAFLLGLSMGVHFLALLTVPAIGMIYFFKTYKRVDIPKFILANIVVVITLLFIYKMFIPLTMNLFGKSEVFFVNVFGMPFHSGTIFLFLLYTGLFVGLLILAKKKGWRFLFVSTLCLIFILVGFCSWLILPIRANAKVPINENDPSSAISLLAYYNREQYGDVPVFYGPQFTATLDKSKPYSKGNPIYERNFETEKYDIVGYNDVPNWDTKHNRIFPRMVSRQSNNVANYKQIAGIINTEEPPSMRQNLGFFFNYQVGYMYLRYLFWNYVGRQNDIQGRMDGNGNWESGVGFIDNVRLGDQELIPDFHKNNPAKNHYYFLPLLLGLIGLILHFRYNPQQAYAVLLLFLLTGIGVTIYTNTRPFEPRERDYAFVGSFYTYAIWLGIGISGLFLLLVDIIKQKKALALALVTVGLGIPLLLASENWNDHDRSDRYGARNTARAYLQSCDPNSILFSYGDNDTFPVWYIQEVEEYRTDVKCINLSLFNTDWHIDQAKRKSYDASPVPSNMVHSQYRTGTRDVVYFYDKYQISDRVMLIKDFMEWINAEKKNRLKTSTGEAIFYPTTNIRIPVNKKNVLKSGIVSPEDSALILPYIDITLKTILDKKDILMLDIIATSDWTRPIYFTTTSPSSVHLGLDDYFQLEGLNYKFVPIRTPKASQDQPGRININKMDEKISQFEFKNTSDPSIYVDETYRRDALMYRQIYGRYADTLLRSGNTQKAVEVLDQLVETFPPSVYEYRSPMISVINLYYQSGEIDKARKIVDELMTSQIQYMKYYLSLYNDNPGLAKQNIRTPYSVSRTTMYYVNRYDSEYFTRYDETLREIFEKVVPLIQ